MSVNIIKASVGVSYGIIIHTSILVPAITAIRHLILSYVEKRVGRTRRFSTARHETIVLVLGNPASFPTTSSSLLSRLGVCVLRANYLDLALNHGHIVLYPL